MVHFRQTNSTIISTTAAALKTGRYDNSNNINDDHGNDDNNDDDNSKDGTDI